MGQWERACKGANLIGGCRGGSSSSSSEGACSRSGGSSGRGTEHHGNFFSGGEPWKQWTRRSSVTVTTELCGICLHVCMCECVCLIKGKATVNSDQQMTCRQQAKQKIEGEGWTSQLTCLYHYFPFFFFFYILSHFILDIPRTLCDNSLSNFH